MVFKKDIIHATLPYRQSAVLAVNVPLFTVMKVYPVPSKSFITRHVPFETLESKNMVVVAVEFVDVPTVNNEFGDDVPTPVLPVALITKCVVVETDDEATANSVGKYACFVEALTESIAYGDDVPTPTALLAFTLNISALVDEATRNAERVVVPLTDREANGVDVATPTSPRGTLADVIPKITSPWLVRT